MKKKFTLIVMVFLTAGTLFAQTDRMSYQAVLRNADNELVYNENLSVQVQILDASGAVQYSELHSATTNANGMISLVIGNGTNVTGNLSEVIWQNAVIRSVFTLADGTVITQATPVTAVPYAKYAERAGNVFSGDYNDLVNRPEIPTVPENVSAFNNDAGYITAADIPAETDPTVPAWAKAETKPTYDYSEIENTPTISTVPTNVSAFNNDAGYITAADIPAIPTVPTNVSAFDNDAGYITAAQLNSLLVSMNNTIDSLRNRIGDLEASSNFDSSGDGQPCPGTPTVKDYDNNTYNTVQIGKQCWMKENLRTKHYANGTAITNGGTTSSTTTRYYYNNSSSSINLNNRGYHYNWAAVMNGEPSSMANPSGVQGICPNGWHVPSDAEWSELTDYVRSQSGYLCGGKMNQIAKALASTNNWTTSNNSCRVGNNPSGNNATGFSAVPASAYSQGSFYSNSAAWFWSSTQTDYSSSSAYGRELEHKNAYVSRNSYPETQGLSVRCLRD